MLKKLMLTFLFGAVMFGAMKGFGFAVELALCCAAVIALLVFAAAMFSRTAKYTLKGGIRKIENAAQLANAVEILEEKNSEMSDEYFKVSVALKRLDGQIGHWTKKAAGKKDGTDIKKALEDGVKKLEAAKAKLSALKDRMHISLAEHKSKVEVLKTKLLELESLKTVNSYLKDVSVGTELGDGINDLVDQALANEEAMNEALSEFDAVPAARSCS